MRITFIITAVLLGVVELGLAQRPRVDWVWRGVMDFSPRQVTMALHEKMYISWDPAICGLFQAWQAWDNSPLGGVDFASAPYDDRSGPQPKARGPKVYFRNGLPEEEGFSTNPVKNTVYNKAVWSIDDEAPFLRFLGYRFNESGDQVTLKYHMVLPGKPVIEVTESPDYIEVNGDAGLVRRFSFTGVSPGMVLKLNLNSGNWQVSGTGSLQDSLLVQTMDGTTVVTGAWE